MWPFNTSDKVTKGFQIGCQTSIDCIGRRIIIQHHVVNAHQLSKLEPFLETSGNGSVDRLFGTPGRIRYGCPYTRNQCKRLFCSFLWSLFLHLLLLSW
jgi:hypothetical protein